MRFEVGDIISFTKDKDDSDYSPRLRAVIVSAPENKDAKGVALEYHECLVGTAYEDQRGWYMFPNMYRPRRVKPTDEEQAIAMRILLTGYVPGVDDG